MTAKSPGVLQVVKDASLGMRLCLAAVWFGALGAGIGSLWTGDWLSVVFFLAVIVAQTWILVAFQRGAPPAALEKTGIAAVSTLVLLLSVVIIVRDFFS